LSLPNCKHILLSLVVCKIRSVGVSRHYTILSILLAYYATGVYVTMRCLSVCLSHAPAAAACGGFAAVGPAGGRYRLTVAGERHLYDYAQQSTRRQSIERLPRPSCGTVSIVLPPTNRYTHRANSLVLCRRSSYWRRGVVVSGVRRMNEVNARRARLVSGWVTIFGWVYHLGM